MSQAGPPGVGVLLTNLGELALAGSLFATERRLARSDGVAGSPPARTAPAASRT